MSSSLSEQLRQIRADEYRYHAKMIRDRLEQGMPKAEVPRILKEIQAIEREMDDYVI